MAALIGREPFTDYEVAVRCPFGRPAVVRNAAHDPRGRPFPTRDWLVCRALADAVSRLEAAGGVRMLEADEAMREPVQAAHRRHQRLHDGHRVAGCGNPEHVKCLHAQLAFAMDEGGTPVSEWIAARAGLRWPDRCCLDGRAPGGGG